MGGRDGSRDAVGGQQRLVTLTILALAECKKEGRALGAFLMQNERAMALNKGGR